MRVMGQCDTALSVDLRLLSDGVKDQLLVTIQKTFNYSRGQAQQIFLMVMECMKKRALVSPAFHLCLQSVGGLRRSIG